MKFTRQILGLFLILCASLGMAQTLVYERTYADFPEGDNTLRISLSESGQVVIERPTWMTHSGTHAFSVSPQQHFEFQQKLQSLPFDTSETQTRLNQRGQIMYFTTDTEYSRFMQMDSTRGVQDVVEIRSLPMQAQLFENDSYLDQARALEHVWWSMMNELLEIQAP